MLLRPGLRTPSPSWRRRKPMPLPDASSRPVVVKVGGSLYDLPDLGPRLQHWLDGQAGRQILLVPGGGSMADVLRDLDDAHGLGEETAHWLALRALALNAHVLAALLPEAVVAAHPDQCLVFWRRGQLAVLDAYAFAASDEHKIGSLPHRWTVTSDSIAARAARLVEARQLILLKSVMIPPGIDWREAAQRGWVDAYFPEAIGNALTVDVVNFRAYVTERR